MTNVITFKSTPENYEKEKSGVKCNTVRNTTDWSADRWKRYHKADTIQIENTIQKDFSKMEFFQRKITDKTEFEVEQDYGEPKTIVIISWRE